jgi:Ran GTPase-activating protein (RanGAP) involved in mRNA processing and transport
MLVENYPEHRIGTRMCDYDLQTEQKINNTTQDYEVKLILEKVLKNPKLKEINYNSKQNIINVSPWKEVIEVLDLLTDCEVTIDTDTSDQKLIINTIAKNFAEQLNLDQIEMLKNQPVSECALLCPSWDTKYDKLFGICSDISSLLFPKDEITSSHDHEMKIYNKFTKTLSRLRNAYREQAKAYEKEEVAFRSILCSNKREKFAELKALPISHNILKPTASTSVRYVDDDNATLDPLIHHIKYCQHIFDDKVFERGAIMSNNEKLDVSFQALDIQMLESLFDAVKTNDSIQHILLGNNPIGDPGAEIIGKFIRENRIKSWYICACDFTADGIQMICDALNCVQTTVDQLDSKQNMVESLWLKRNPLTPQGIRCIAEMIRTNNSIKILDLSSTGMLDEGCGYLFDALKHNRTLESLYIGCNGITIEGARSIAEYFNHLSQHDLQGITNLYIDVNRLDDQGTEIICDAITTVNQIKRISFGSNRMSHIGAKKIFDTFAESKQLIFLDIGTCKSTPKVRELPNNIGDQGVEHIIEFLKMNQSVQLFNIRHIGLTPTGLDVLDMAFKNNLNNTSLLKLFVEQAGVNKQSVMNSLANTLTTITNRNQILYYNLCENDDQYDRQFLKDLLHDMSLIICHHRLTKNVVSQYVKKE